MNSFGTLLTALLHYFAVLAPLVPVAIIFYKRLYNQPPFNLLSGLCGLYAISNLLEAIAMQSDSPAGNAFNCTICSLLELVLGILLLRSLMTQTRWSSVFLYVLVSYASILLTYIVLKGMPGIATPLHGLGKLLLLVLALICIAMQMRDASVYLMRQPAFWIACGTAIYLSIYFLLWAVSTFGFYQSAQGQRDFMIFSKILQLVQYAFFVLAAWVAVALPPTQKQVKLAKAWHGSPL
jgi:hypothetical protein